MKKTMIFFVFFVLSIILFSAEVNRNNINNTNNLRGYWLFSAIDDINYKEWYADETDFIEVKVPGFFSDFKKNYKESTWYRKHFRYKKEVNEDMVLLLGKIDDEDEVYFNGKKIGETKTQYYDKVNFTSYYEIDRIYHVPKELIMHENVIAVKVTNNHLEGGFYSGDIGIIEESYFFDIYLYKYKKLVTIDELPYIFFAGLFFALAVFQLFVALFLNRKINIALSLILIIFSFYLFLKIGKRDYFLPFSSNTITQIEMSVLIVLMIGLNYFIYNYYKGKIYFIYFSAQFMNFLFVTLIFFEKNQDNLRNIFVIWYGFLFIQVLIITYIVLTNKEKHKMVISFGVASLVGAIFYDLFYDLGMIKLYDGYTLLFGFILLVLSIIITTSREYLKMYVEIEKLNKKLEEKVGQGAIELEATQEKLMLTEKLAAIGRLSGGIAHELNSPLGAVLTTVQLMKNDIEAILDESVKDNLKDSITIIEEGTKKSKDIISNLIKYKSHDDYTKQQNEKIELWSAIESVLDRVYQENIRNIRAVEIRNNVEEKVYIKGNALMIKQAFYCVIVNAIDAVIEKKQIDSKRVVISSKVENGKITISIMDNGIGMKADTKRRIFDPFFTTKGMENVNGLGLSICYDILRKYEAEIEVESNYGEGTDVRIIFKEFA